MQILHIKPVEQVQVDRGRLGTLFVQLGEREAEEILCRALEELALRLGRCEKQFRQADWVALRKNVRSLIAIGEQIGMQVMAQVAGDVTRCIDRSDATATAATLARLIRVGERSLTAVWDAQDVPG